MQANENSHWERLANQIVEILQMLPVKNTDKRTSRVISKLIKKFGPARVYKMINLYESQGEPHIALQTWVKTALENHFKSVPRLQVVTCPLSGSPDAITIGSYIYYSHFINLKKCASCNLGYVDTRLDHQTIASHFETAYKDEEYFLRTRSNCYRQILKIIQQFSSGIRLLDVGCAKGHFLRMAIDAGFEGTGCDISEEPVKYSIGVGLTVHKGEAWQLDYSNAYFDIITCLDTLYYSLYIKADISKMAALLKQNGILVLRLPNRNLGWCSTLSKIVSVLGIRSNYKNLLFFNPEHLYIFEKHFFRTTIKNLVLIAYPYNLQVLDSTF